MSKPFYQKPWFWVIIVIVIIGIGSAIASSNKDPQKVSSDSGNGSSNQSQTESNQNKEFAVGDTIAIDGQEVKVVSVEHNYTPTQQYVTLPEGKEYVKLNLQIRNNSSSTIDYNALYWTIEDSTGDIINYSGAAFAQADDQLNSGQLAAGGTKNASIVFEVPAGDTKLKVHFKPNLFLDREAIINL